MSSIATATTRRRPITSQDVISISGRYLYVGSSNNTSTSRRRFFMKGIAFPVPPPSEQKDGDAQRNISTTGWIAILEQLANETDINTIRLYDMDCSKFDDDYYSEFINKAAELGIYVMIPLTTTSGEGVLYRDIEAPDCYPNTLYDYGTMCLKEYSTTTYPNIIAGVIGNEVMNNLLAWNSAPCVKAYLDDLARYGNNNNNNNNAINDNDNNNNNNGRRLPLIYATQHDSPSAEQLPDEAIKLTLDYLSCKRSDDDDDDHDDDDHNNNNNNNILDNTFILGINIESWCSSLQTFEYEENGVDESSYYSLWKVLSNGTKTEETIDAITGDITTNEIPSISPDPVSIPIVFSEMGCSKILFNRDNNVQPKFVRDWKQISVVSENGQMSDVISGFVAYGYDGGGFNNAFRMMGGNELWDGIHVLPRSLDYDNFRNELSKVVVKANNADDDNKVQTKTTTTTTTTAGTTKPPSSSATTAPLSCKEISTKLTKLWGVELYPIENMPSYFINNSQKEGSSRPKNAFLLEEENGDTTRIMSSLMIALAVIVLVLFCFGAVREYWKMKKKHRRDIVLASSVEDYGSCVGS